MPEMTVVNQRPTPPPHGVRTVSYQIRLLPGTMALLRTLSQQQGRTQGEMIQAALEHYQQAKVTDSLDIPTDADPVRLS